MKITYLYVVYHSLNRGIALIVNRGTYKELGIVNDPISFIPFFVLKVRFLNLGWVVSLAMSIGLAFLTGEMYILETSDQMCVIAMGG